MQLKCEYFGERFFTQVINEPLSFFVDKEHPNLREMTAWLILQHIPFNLKNASEINVWYRLEFFESKDAAFFKLTWF